MNDPRAETPAPAIELPPELIDKLRITIPGFYIGKIGDLERAIGEVWQISYARGHAAGRASRDAELAELTACQAQLAAVTEALRLWKTWAESVQPSDDAGKFDEAYLSGREALSGAQAQKMAALLTAVEEECRAEQVLDTTSWPIDHALIVRHSDAREKRRVAYRALYPAPNEEANK